MIKIILMISLTTVILSAKDIVLDNETDLIWQDNSDIGRGTWSEAKEHCESLSLEGYRDWRLPNIDELMSISDKTRYEPAIKEVFKHTKNAIYWSSTEHKNDYSQAWLVYFGNGDVYYDNKSDKEYVRCVRGGQ